LPHLLGNIGWIHGVEPVRQGHRRVLWRLRFGRRRLGIRRHCRFRISHRRFEHLLRFLRGSVGLICHGAESFCKVTTEIEHLGSDLLAAYGGGPCTSSLMEKRFSLCSGISSGDTAWT
jgi:hypothetical protein